MVRDIENARGDYRLSVYSEVAKRLGFPVWTLFLPEAPVNFLHGGCAAALEAAIHHWVATLEKLVPDGRQGSVTTTAALMAEMRRMRTPDAEPMTLAQISEALLMILDSLLGTFDYKVEPTSAPAFYARCLAALLAGIEGLLGRPVESRLP